MLLWLRNSPAANAQRVGERAGSSAALARSWERPCGSVLEAGEYLWSDLLVVTCSGCFGSVGEAIAEAAWKPDTV